MAHSERCATSIPFHGFWQFVQVHCSPHGSFCLKHAQRLFVHPDLQEHFVTFVMVYRSILHHDAHIIKSANARVVQPRPRPVRQENANTTTETIMAGDYAKTTARGCGQYQRFVSTTCYFTTSYPLACSVSLSVSEQVLSYRAVPQDGKS